MVRITALESKSGSSGDVDDGDKDGTSPSQKYKRRRKKKKVSAVLGPLDQHGNVFNHKPRRLFHITFKYINIQHTN